MNHQDNNNNDNDDQISGRKRKSNQDFFHSSPNNTRRLISPPPTTTTTPFDENDLLKYALTLTLGPSSPSPPPPPPPQPPQPQTQQTLFLPQPNNDYKFTFPFHQPNNDFNLLPPPQTHNYILPPLPTSQQLPSTALAPTNNATRATRARRTPSRRTREGKSETVPAPYEWATDKRARIHTMETLLSRQIYTIKGQVQCKKCDRKYELGFNLQEKFMEIARFIMENKSGMHDRAPESWRNPVLPTCSFCEAENSVKPLISEKKRSINWLFLLLGQMLGCCTLEQLKYFCKHTFNHRTGAKDRVLYLAYLCMCKQLDPSGPFAR